MKQLIKTMFTAVLICMITTIHAQDVIVKTDKSEIKSKVTEITETSIKYKKWDNVDGPMYNIAKDEVFMIIYANGQREVIKKDVPATNGTSSQSLQQSTSTTSDISSTLNQSASSVDTSINYKIIRVKYKPTRINVSLQAPLSIGTNYEFRVVKNIFNAGIAYDYVLSKDPDIISENFGFIYGSFYLPLNRVMANYKNQDKGLFVFAHVGYGYTYAQVKNFDGGTDAVTSGAFTWRAGLDYFVTPGFGISLSSYQFKNAYAGIAIRL